MLNSGWPHSESPFHAGEQAIQERMGVRTSIEAQGRRIIRDYLTEQHQQFYAQLPFLIAGTVDANGQPWASILVGAPGFVFAPDHRTLQVNSKPLVDDPIAPSIAVGSDIGLLGIEFSTRRRNRINGTITAVTSDGFTVQVGQSFGNCPQYIQSRTMKWRKSIAIPVSASTFSALTAPAIALIAASDTFLIATAFQSDKSNLGQGVDVSHRGGKPGFVRIDDPHRLTFPDFAGNLHFSTIGNLLLNPAAGLLFIDFDRGDLLYLTGRAEVVWDAAEVAAFVGAERLIRFQILQGYRVEASLPLRGSAPNYSPFLDRTGTWT